jgi:hypothetical protein
MEAPNCPEQKKGNTHSLKIYLYKYGEKPADKTVRIYPDYIKPAYVSLLHMAEDMPVIRNAVVQKP